MKQNIIFRTDKFFSLWLAPTPHNFVACCVCTQLKNEVNVKENILTIKLEKPSSID